MCLANIIRSVLYTEFPYFYAELQPNVLMFTAVVETKETAFTILTN